MGTKDDYVAVKQRDLQELDNEIAAHAGDSHETIKKFRDSCQAARSSLDRIVSSDDAEWESLQPIVDGAFRHAYDCLQRLRAS